MNYPELPECERARDTQLILVKASPSPSLAIVHRAMAEIERYEIPAIIDCERSEQTIIELSVVWLI